MTTRATKLLHTAVAVHDRDETPQPIPLTFDTTEQAVHLMRDALIHDGHVGLSKPLAEPPEDPRFCVVDLHTDSPGIVHTTRPRIEILHAPRTATDDTPPWMADEGDTLSRDAARMAEGPPYE